MNLNEPRIKKELVIPEIGTVSSPSWSPNGDKIAYYFQTTHLQGLLRRLDNATMLCSVEARVPFVDHRLIERLAGVSFEYKMGNSFKEPLKRIFGPMIPKEIVERKKIGFPVPLDSVFENYLPSQKQPSFYRFLYLIWQFLLH